MLTKTSTCVLEAFWVTCKESNLSAGRIPPYSWANLCLPFAKYSTHSKENVLSSRGTQQRTVARSVQLPRTVKHDVHCQGLPSELNAAPKATKLANHSVSAGLQVPVLPSIPLQLLKRRPASIPYSILDRYARLPRGSSTLHSMAAWKRGG